MVADPMHPARQTYLLADIALTQGTAGMGPVIVHRLVQSVGFQALPPRIGPRPGLGRGSGLGWRNAHQERFFEAQGRQMTASNAAEKRM